MTRIAILVALALTLISVPAFAADAVPTDVVARTQDALETVRTQTAATWSRARAARDAMNELRHDGSLATDAGRARMDDLRAELDACRAALSALKLERRTIIAARKSARAGTAVATR